MEVVGCLQNIHFSVASVMVDCTDTLFTPGKLGELPLKNRIIYPAMTRGRCGGRLAGSENIKYYAARAGTLHHLPTSRVCVCVCVCVCNTHSLTTSRLDGDGSC